MLLRSELDDNVARFIDTVVRNWIVNGNEELGLPVADHPRNCTRGQESQHRDRSSVSSLAISHQITNTIPTIFI